MAISGVNPKCYILALFVRDDGARFLLGDDPFEFKDNQLHFQQNTMANDVVEVQGNDGYLLAGQVRRPGTQVFDGYVCNGTNSKEEVEAKRRSFLQFFRRSHFYKVIYVFPNGTAIQRKQGFLVDDPTVQELYQQYPEYHVALNFEDVNYYTYEEDDQGHEIYAKEAIVALARGGATGGLIWDSYGVVWEDAWSLPLSISGVQFQILNNAGARAPIENVELYGDTYQQTYSGKNVFNENDLTFDRANVSANQIQLSALATGIRFDTTYISTTGSPSITFNTGIDLTPLAGKTIRLKANFGEKGEARIIRLNSDSLSAETQSLTVSGDTISWVVPNDLGSAKWLGYGFRIVHPSNEKHTVDFTNVCLTIDNADMNYEPYTGGIPAPNPDYPQPIQVVTGEQTVTVSDGGSNTQTFTVDLGSTELCKIGNYQDKIFNNDPNEDWYDPDLEDNAWYVHKVCGKFIFNGTENWQSNPNYTSAFNISRPSTIKTGETNMVCNQLSNFNTSLANISDYGIVIGGSLNIKNINITNGDVTEFKSWLNSSNLIIYYPLLTPTDTKITDATLVGQLEALGAMKLFIGENNVLVSATSPNLPATLAFDYYTKFTAIGAEWEEGGTKGATIVNVDAIDNTYPVWELTGPATNPTLSVLTTNTTLTYNGTITASQKLVIDMFNKTATLNGTSVIGNISGDFVYMAPGTNRVTYTAGNTDAPDSTIYWQEVVG